MAEGLNWRFRYAQFAPKAAAKGAAPTLAATAAAGQAAPQVQTGGTGFQPSNLIETPQIDLAPIIAEARQIADTGAQGAATPSYSREAAERSTAVSRILEKQLGGLAQPGFGDIISAALQTIQKPGQVDFASALRQGQAQDINRAYNIANALSGLQRRNAQQEIGPRDMLRIVQEQAARGDPLGRATFVGEGTVRGARRAGGSRY